MTAALPLLPDTAPFAPEHIDALNAVMARTNAEQRQWLSGFLAGYHAATAGAPLAAPAAAPRARVPLTILYATELGNAEGVGADLKKAAAQAGLRREAARHGRGQPGRGRGPAQPPGDREHLGRGRSAGARRRVLQGADGRRRAALRWRALRRARARRFELRQFLRGRAPHRCAPRGAGRRADRAAGRVRSRLRSAGRGLVGRRARGAGQARRAGSGAGRRPAATIIHVDFAAPRRLRCTPRPIRSPPRSPRASTSTAAARPSRRSISSCRSRARASTFEPGDSLGIVPENDPEMVEAVLRAAGLDGDDALRDRLTQRVRHHGALASGHRGLRRAHLGPASCATCSRATAGAPMSTAGRSSICSRISRRSWRRRSSPACCASCRRGSIRSPRPLAASPDEAHLLVAAVRYESHGRAPQGRRLRASRRPPAQPATGCRSTSSRTRTSACPPIRTAGHHDRPRHRRRAVPRLPAGARRRAGAGGRNWLFFGDRNFTHDFLYQLEWQEWLKDGVLTRLDVAFSRDQPEKVYVQHRMWQRRAELYRLARGRRASLRLRRRQGMAQDVHARSLRSSRIRAGRAPRGRRGLCRRPQEAAPLPARRVLDPSRLTTTMSARSLVDSQRDDQGSEPLPARHHRRWPVQRRDRRDRRGRRPADQVPRHLPAGRPRPAPRAPQAEAGAGLFLHDPRPRARRRLHAAQWLAMDRIATEYANGTIRLTTRQAFQFHGVIKSNLKRTMQAINTALLDTIAACGDVNRNVMCNPNPYQSRAHAAALELARAISDHLTPAHPRLSRDLAGRREGGRHAGGRGADLRPPLPAAQVQDRRRRAAVQRRRHLRPGSRLHRHHGENGELVGYNVTVGGGMGMTHGEPETYPRIADVIGFCRPEQVVDVAEKVVLVQRDYGDRSRPQARAAQVHDRRSRHRLVPRRGRARASATPSEAPRPFAFDGQRRPLRLGAGPQRQLALHAVRRRTAACSTGRTGRCHRPARDRRDPRGRLPPDREPEPDHRERRPRQKRRIEQLLAQYGSTTTTSGLRLQLAWPASRCRPAASRWPRASATCRTSSPRSRR